MVHFFVKDQLISRPSTDNSVMSINMNLDNSACNIPDSLLGHFKGKPAKTMLLTKINLREPTMI